MIAEIILVIMQLLCWGVYVGVASRGVSAAVNSASLFKNPLFIGGVVLLGLITSLVLWLYGLVATSNVLILSTMVGIGSMFLLTEGSLKIYCN